MPGARQADDEDRSVDLLVIDLGMESGRCPRPAVGPRAGRPAGRAASTSPMLGEVALAVHRLHQALEPLAVVVAAGVVEARLGPGVLLDLLDVEAHRANRRLTARRRTSMTAARSLGRHASGAVHGNSSASRSNGTTSGGRHRRGVGPDAAQDDRPLAVPGGVQPVGDARILVGDHHPHLPVVVHHGLVAVEARLVIAVVDRLPPGVPERVAPVETLRRRHLDDQRLVGGQLPRADDRTVLGRRPHGRAVQGRQEGIGRLGIGEVQEEAQVLLEEVAQGDHLAGHGGPAGRPAPWSSTTAAPESGSMDMVTGTSCSQS